MTSEIVLNPLQPEPLAESTEPQSSDNTTEANLRALSVLHVRPTLKLSQKAQSRRDRTAPTNTEASLCALCALRVRPENSLAEIRRDAEF